MELKPCPEAAIAQIDKDVIAKGLTMQFRETVVYKKMVADILHLSPNASSFEIDTAIWWYISYPDMFESEHGMSLIDAMEKRVNHNIGPGIKELEDDVNSYSIPESGQLPIRDDSGVHATESSNAGSDSTKSRHPSPTADTEHTTKTEDRLPQLEE
jgi:hypothetical protein